MVHPVAQKTKILLVDDEVAILHALGMYLEQEGYSVKAVAKFDNYLANRHELPDLVILDILLNQEDGLNITRQLKSSPHTSQIPVIMISALPGGQELATAVGADAFLAKPFDAHELNQIIQRFTEPAKLQAVAGVI